MITKGSIAKEHSIYIISRNNKLMHFTSWSVREVVALEGTPNDIARVDDNIFLSFFDGLIRVFSSALVPIRSISTKENIHCISNLYIEKLGHSRGLAVVGNTTLRVYDTSGVALLSSSKVDDEVVSMKFGKLGREEGCLFLLYKNRGIEVKIFNRRMLNSSEVFFVSQR